MKKIYLFLLVAFITSSCATTQYRYKYEESTARYLEPAMQGFITPSTADLNISNTRIYHTETFPNNLNSSDFRTSYSTASTPFSTYPSAQVQTVQPSINFDSKNVTYIKNYTIGEAVKKYNADVIVGPIFEIKTSEDFQTITVTVSGYPATYVNFRKATKEDIELMKSLNATNITIEK